MEEKPMKFIYEPCCGVQRDHNKTIGFISGEMIRVISCPTCDRELRMPDTTPDYKFYTLWNSIANKGER